MTDAKDYVPTVGNTIGFFLTAGNGRLMDGSTSVRERTNVVAVQIPPNNDGECRFAATGQSQPQPQTPHAPDQTQTVSDERLNQFVETIAELRQRLDRLERDALKSGDRVALRTDNRHVVCADGGGGGAVHSDRETVGGWETFKLEKQ